MEYGRIRKQAGRRLVYTLVFLPILGWAMLYYLWDDWPGMRIDAPLMRWMTDGLVQEMGADEKRLAGMLFLVCMSLKIVFLCVGWAAALLAPAS